jgi:ribosomal protein L16 Arg81 hydroxylase
MSDEPGVPFSWRKWAALAMLRGTDATKAIATVVTETGMSEEKVAVAVASLFKDPAFQAGEVLSQQIAKLESVLGVLRDLDYLDPPAHRVERRRGLSRAEFLHDFYARNRPVVLEDVCDDWRAKELWTPQYLAERLGTAEVEVMIDRDADDRYEINSGSHRIVMPFDEYVAKVKATEWGNDLYLVANNHLLESEAARPLWDDFYLDQRYMIPDSRGTGTFLWFGPAGTVTPFHHDIVNIFFHQVLGRKRFILVPPLDTPVVANWFGVYSEIDPTDPDLERFPRFREARQFDVCLGPGDALFLPVGWWHHVTAIDLSISISATTFAFPNDFVFQNPKRAF